MDKSLQKQLTRWLKQQKKACGFFLNLTVLLGLLTGFSLMLQAYLISRILHQVIILELPPSALNNEFIYLLLLLPIRALLAFARERTSFEAGKRLRQQIRQTVLNKLTELGPAYIKGKPAGSWASIVLEQIEDLQDFYARYLPQMLLAGFIPLCILVVVFPLNWVAGLILLFTAPLIPLFMILVGMGAAEANRKNFHALAQLSGHFMDRLKGLSTLKRFNRANAEVNQIEVASESFRQRTMSVLRLAFLSSAVLEFFAALSIAVLAIYFGFSFLGEINIGRNDQPIALFTGLFILMLAPEFYQPLRDMGTHYHAKAQAIGAAEALTALLDYQVPEQPPHASSVVAGDHKTALNWASPLQLTAENLCVYSHDGTQLVGPVSFTLKQGEHIALVGPSGAGKSSLLNALLGFLPYQGSIQINGVELHEIDKAEWRKQLAWLGQDPQLFHGTVLENVTMGNDNITIEQVEACLQQANIDAFIAQQPQGLHYRIGEQMSGLSVGQAQRIALARALAQNAQLFLLDEPTASLDQHSEQAVLQALQVATAQSASLMVTHRLDQLQQKHTLLVLDKGLIVQQGDFLHLQQTQGLFKQMLQDEQASPATTATNTMSALDQEQT